MRGIIPAGVVLTMALSPAALATKQVTVTARVLVEGVEATEVAVGQDFQLEVWIQDTSTHPDTPAGVDGAYCSISWDGELLLNNDNIDDDFSTDEDVKAVINPVWHKWPVDGRQEPGSSLIKDIGGQSFQRQGHLGALWLVRLNFTALAVGDPQLEVISDKYHFPIWSEPLLDQVVVIGPELAVVPGEPTGFVLTTLVEPAGAGTITRDPDLAGYPDGTEVWLTAEAATGFRFVEWSGDLNCSPDGGPLKMRSGPGGGGSSGPGMLPCEEPEISLNMDADKTVTANFTPLGGTHYTLTLNIQPAGAGIIEAVPDLETYSEGAEVTLTATPLLGYEFVAWTGDAFGFVNTTTVVMTADRTVTALFQEDQSGGQYRLVTTVSPPEGGRITRIPDQEFFEPDFSVSLIAQAAEDFTFSHWTGVTLAIGTDAVVVMDSNKDVVAYFEHSGPTNYQVAGEALPAMGGTVSVSPLLAEYPPGTEVTLTAEPAAGYVFAGWTGAASGSANPLTLTVTGHTLVTAHFQSSSQASASYTLQVSVSPGTFAGTVRLSPDLSSYPAGTAVTLEAEPAFGFSLLGWGGDASGSGERIAVVINRDLQIEASFGPMLGAEACGAGAVPFVVLTLGMLGLVSRLRRG